jgi:selenocysteine-specific elongation factor
MSSFNFNIGLLGHVDSGKTSLAKALSSIASTASFDRNPQSQERGITLDLGFSSFSAEAKQSIKDAGYAFVQYTLVDCPGHASLIKTIIGGKIE